MSRLHGWVDEKDVSYVNISQLFLVTASDEAWVYVICKYILDSPMSKGLELESGA